MGRIISFLTVDGKLKIKIYPLCIYLVYFVCGIGSEIFLRRTCSKNI